MECDGGRGIEIRIEERLCEGMREVCVACSGVYFIQCNCKRKIGMCLDGPYISLQSLDLTKGGRET